MLLTDFNVVTLRDLLQIDAEVSSVALASKPAIKVEGDGSVIAQSWNESAAELQSAMQLYGTFLGSSGMQAHAAAILDVGGPARQTPRVRLNQVVTQDYNYSQSSSPLKTWLIYRALYLFYRDASSRVVTASGKDRYDAKAEKFQQFADGKAFTALKSNGLPVVYKPLECPGSIHAFQAGQWGFSNLSSVSGGTNPAAQNVQVAITYYDASVYVSPSSKGNGESGPSDVVNFTIAANQLLHVDISSLMPPTGTMEAVGTASGIYTPLNATHWNIYAGPQVQSDPPNGPSLNVPMYLQRSGLPIATKSATLAVDPVFSGTRMQLGQFPDTSLTFQKLAGRG